LIGCTVPSPALGICISAWDEHPRSASSYPDAATPVRRVISLFSRCYLVC